MKVVSKENMTDRELLELLVMKITNIEAGQQSTNQRLDQIEAGQQSTNQRLDRIEAEQFDMKGEILQLKQAVLETAEVVAVIPDIQQAVLEVAQDIKLILDDQKSIHEILGEHEVSIRSLRRKPV